jgi:hypothetical protein
MTVPTIGTIYKNQNHPENPASCNRRIITAIHGNNLAKAYNTNKRPTQRIDPKSSGEATHAAKAPNTPNPTYRMHHW